MREFYAIFATPLLNKPRKIILAKPRGFCAGVNRAIDIVNIALEKYGAPLYVRHEIVHNHHVVNDFKSRGVVFVEDLDDVPDNACVIFSAHGTAPAVLSEAKQRGLKFIDAVCPLVIKVHNEISKAISVGKKVVYIGHRGHQEVLGAIGYAYANLDQGSKATAAESLRPEQDIYLVETVTDVERLIPILHDEDLVVATQTTLSIDDTLAIVRALEKSFQRIEFPKSDDICYATQNRQDAVKELVKFCDHILIIGSENSSNTLRLLELARKSGLSAELVPDPDQYRVSGNLNGKIVGISSGASAPESLLEALVSKLGAEVSTLDYKEEKIVFPLPKELMV
jgi:4-hydroxy-3-methylbut-2-enyl diphosphate reductase